MTKWRLAVCLVLVLSASLVAGCGVYLYSVFTRGEVLWESEDTGYCVSVSPNHQDIVVAVGCHRWPGGISGRVACFIGGSKDPRISTVDVPFHAVAYSKRGDMIAAVDSGCTLHVWDSNFKKITEATVQGSSSVAFSPSDPIIASGGQFSIALFNHRTHTSTTLEGHGGPVNALVFSPCGNYLYSGSDDCSIRVWDIKAGKEVSKLIGHTERVTSLLLVKDKLLVSGSFDSTVRFWNVKTPKQEAFVRDLKVLHGIFAMASSPNDSTLAVAHGTSISLFSPETLDHLEDFRSFGSTFRGVAFLDESQLISITKSGTVGTWRTR